MLRYLYAKEIQLSLRSVRFVIALAIVMVGFAVSGIVGSASYHNQLTEYRQRQAEATRNLMDQMGGLNNVAVYQQAALLPPSKYPYIRDLSITRLPECVLVNAARHQEMEKVLRSNPLLYATEAFTWQFILAAIGGFIAILLSYDSVAEERRQGTINLIFSNPINRWKLITGKLLALITINAVLIAAGILLSLLILSFSGVPVLSSDALATTAAFLGFAILYAAFVTALGLLVSTMTRTPSLALTALFFIWVTFSIIFPSAARITAGAMQSIPTPDEREREIDQAIDEIMDENNNTRPTVNGSQIVNYSRIPFTAVETHVANGIVRAIEAAGRLQQKHENLMFDQGYFGLDLARWSPVELFRESVGKLTDSDIDRWRRFLTEVEIYRRELGSAVSALDSRDPNSPHVYFQDDVSIWISLRPVEDATQIPRFEMREPPFSDRLAGALLPAAWLFIWTVIAVLLAVIVFMMVDLRQQQTSS